MSTMDRIPPQSLEAELATIGAAMLDREALEIVVETVRPADFYAHVHETVFAVICELHDREKPVDKLAVAERLRDRGQLEQIGGVSYLSSMLDHVPTAASAQYYASIVAEKAQLRGLIRAGSQISECGFDGEADAERAVAKAESLFSAAVDRAGAHAGGAVLSDALRRHRQALADRASGNVPRDAVFTPWQGLNAVIGPLLPGEAALWVAAAGSGKSAALLQVADWIAATYGDTALFSLEMSEPAIAMRYCALYGRVSARRQRIGSLDEFELKQIDAALETLASRPLTVFDSQSVQRLSDIRRELRVLSRHGRVRAICIDGIQFLRDVDPQRGDRSTMNDRLDFVYRELLRFAKDFGAVVHAVQHVNREGMSGPPAMRDIRGGGNPEGHMHAIIAPYRPHPNGTPDERREGEFIVLKAREGGADVVRGMEFIGHRSMWLETGKSPWFEPEPPPADDDAQHEFDLALGATA